MQVYTKPVHWTGVHKTSLLYKNTQNQFTVQVYTAPVYCTSVHQTSLLYKCTQNQFTSLMLNNERNVHGQNITKVQVSQNPFLYSCTQNQFTIQVYTKPVYCTSVHKTSLLVNNEGNVHGQNNSKECTWTEHYKTIILYTIQVYTKLV